MNQWEDLLREFNIIQTKHWQHFRKAELSDHYIIQEDENQILRFAFKEDSFLPEEIKQECLDVFKKYHSNQRMA